MQFIKIIFGILSLIHLKTTLFCAETPVLKPYPPQSIVLMLNNTQERTEHGEQDAFTKTLKQISSHNPELKNIQDLTQYIATLKLEQSVHARLTAYLQAQQTTQPAPSHFAPFFSPSDDLIKKLVSLIQDEPSSIKIALYHLTSTPIIDCLIKAKKATPTLSIELCLDRYRHDNKQSLENKQKLSDSDIKINLVGGRKWDMHEKFIIFGQKQLVWQGSYNLTDEKTRDNIILISDEKIIESFDKHFEQLKRASRDNIKASSALSSMPTVIFSPHGGLQQRIIDFIDNENQSIKMAMHTFYPETPITDSLLRAALRHIQVTLIINSNQFNDGSATSKAPITSAVIQRFKDAGINLYTYEGPGIMHHKFFIFDNNKGHNGLPLLLTGSYNITKKAEDMNCEDVIITDAKDAIEKFNTEFTDMIKLAQPATQLMSIKSSHIKRDAPDSITKVPQNSAPKKMRQTTLMPFSYARPALQQK
jgi:phosphatidylserine/phosphatidylglycerophosphate/cardiolipin synthase-like enzyme